MSEKLKKSLILVGLFGVFFGFMTVKHLRMREIVRRLSADPLEAGLPALLELGSISCAPCRVMMPILDELKTEYKGSLSVGFIDIFEDETAARKYGVEIIPTQIFFDSDGEELFRHQGFFSKEDILAKLLEFGVDLAKEE